MKSQTAFLTPISTLISSQHGWNNEKRRIKVTGTIQGDTKREAFGRGSAPPRRTTGYYELRRAGIPEEVIKPDTRSESAFAGVIGLFTAVGLLTPLFSDVSVEAGLAGVAGSLLGIWAIDTLALNSLFGRIAMAGLQNRRKVAIHEAGHLVVGYLLGAQVSGYRLAGFRDAIHGVNGGVEVECGDGWVAAAVGMGGVAAELVEFGGCVGGEDDLKQVGKVVKEIGGGDGIIRWALLAGYEVVAGHREAVKQVADVMMMGGDVQQCFQAIEDTVDATKLITK